MKKKLLGLAALSLLALGIATPSHAQGWAIPRWVDTPLKFINTQVPALADSEFATGDAIRADTTTAFPITELYAPQIPRAGTAVDSTDWCMLVVAPDVAGTGSASAAGAAPAVSADSIYLTTQVSIDGNTWVALTPNIAYQVNVGTARTGAFLLEANSTNCFARVYKLAWAGTGQHQTALVGTAPTDNQMWGYNFVRFILGSANDGRYRASINHWTIKDSYN